MAVFYASILYTKTQTPDDAYFYAQALSRDGQSLRAVRILDQAQLLQAHTSLGLESVLLASQCLAQMGEWLEAAQLLEDASRLPNASVTLEDDAEDDWNALTHHYAGASMHVIARICLWRAKCYDATSHPPRAKTFWKRALLIDCQCVEALDSLLDRHLVSPQEAADLVLSLPIPSSMEWLKQLYLARLPVLVDLYDNNQTSTKEQEHENQPPPSFLNASSIQMSPSSSLLAGDNAVTTPASSKQEIHHALSKLSTVHNLSQSPQYLALAAIRAYQRYDLQSAFQYCQELVQVDPLEPRASFVHAATLLALNYKRLLFALAHEWVQAAPQSAKSWFAVGCYYYACRRYHVAQQHFCRATRLDPLCTEAWIAFGCAFAACDESDQALASFRAAQRLAPYEASALLYMGMEYVRTNHLVLAQHALLAALPSGDPLCMQELGVAHFMKKDYVGARHWFERTIWAVVQLTNSTTNTDDLSVMDLMELISQDYWEPALYNLGHCYRKLLDFNKALACYDKCLVLCPNQALTARGFTLHLMGDLDAALESYHQALASKVDDAFGAEMLNRALQEALDTKLELQEPSLIEEPSFWATATPQSAATAFTLGDDHEDDVDMTMG
jgi:anaphase-promoting complex subunit 6